MVGHHRSVIQRRLFRARDPLVVAPAELVTTTRKAEPLSVLVVTGVVYDVEVAPATFTEFLCH